MKEECTNTAFLAGQYLLQENFDTNNFVYILGQQGLVDELEDVGIKSLPIGVKLRYFCKKGNYYFSQTLSQKMDHGQWMVFQFPRMS